MGVGVEYFVVRTKAGPEVLTEELDSLTKDYWRLVTAVFESREPDSGNDTVLLFLQRETA